MHVIDFRSKKGKKNVDIRDKAELETDGQAECKWSYIDDSFKVE